MNFILASKSPRRHTLLKQIGLNNLKVRPADIDELSSRYTVPSEAVCLISSEKARSAAVSADFDDVVIGADTVVYADGIILGKPTDKTDAFRMLTLLSGAVHEVYTGVTVIFRGQEKSEYEMTRVTFNELSEKEISLYVDTGDPFDKAGAYGIQGLSALFISGIEGDFYNVMGLPLSKLYNMLRHMGINLLEYLD